MLIGGAIKGVTELGKWIHGRKQRKRGVERQQQAQSMWGSRPSMEVPESVTEMVNLYRDMSQRTRVPGQDIIEGNIRGSTAAGIEAAKEVSGGAGGLGAITQMIAGEQDRFSDLGVQAGQMARQGEMMLGQGLGQKGQWQQKAWEWNKAAPWQQRYAEAYGEGHAMEAAGIQNMWGAATGIGNVASDTLLGMAGSGSGGQIDPEALAYLINQLAAQKKE